VTDEQCASGTDQNTVYSGDVDNVLPKLPEDDVHAVVTDPPYGINFQPDVTSGWDDFEPAEYQEWSEGWAREVYRVLKPGGHLLAFSGSRTFHRLICGVEDAGFQIRDTLMWLYGKGFPKGEDLSKSIDSALGIEGSYGDPKSDRYKSTIKNKSSGSFHEGFERPWHNDPEAVEQNARKYLPASDAAQRYQGFRTDLKPAFEPICLARKPLSEETTAENVLEHGTGALNISACRVEAEASSGAADEGRYPSNVVLDGVAAQRLDRDAGETRPGHWTGEKTAGYGDKRDYSGPGDYGGSGGPSRFYYCSKASKSEKTLNGQIDNDHPTVKPVDLMEWLVKLVTAENQKVLDPFAGTGTTLVAAKNVGRECAGIELNDRYADIARVRAGLEPKDLDWIRPDDDQAGLDAFVTDGGARNGHEVEPDTEQEGSR
jgi:site-specific DNA-methyltransferase (adenine-specific)